MLLGSIVVAWLGLAPESVPEPEVPLAIQVPAFLKALGYERELETNGSTLVVAVVFDPGNAASSATLDRLLAVQRELTRLRVKGKPVSLEAVAYAPGVSFGSASVVLVTQLPPGAVEDLSARAGSAGVVTLALHPGDVERGLVLGMESREGKPRFVVNLTAAEAVGASFESSFLDLCRIVER